MHFNTLTFYSKFFLTELLFFNEKCYLPKHPSDLPWITVIAGNILLVLKHQS